MSTTNTTREAEPRIVSLIASATEIVCALGYGSRLVGRSHECDYPAWVADLPVTTRPRFDVDGSSAEVDRQVKILAVRDPARDALGVYEVFPETLGELGPTHLITQTQCEVCAVSLRDVEAAVKQLSRCDAQLVSLQPNTLSDVWDDFRRVAAALGDLAAGERLVESCRARIDALSAQLDGLPRPTVAVIEWVDPLMAAGNWTPTLVAAAGGENLFGVAGEHSPWMSFEELAQADPDVIVIAPCGYSLERALEDLPLLRNRPSWDDLSAVRAGRVFVADGNQYFNRPGPRLADTAEILAEAIHPETFRFGREGSGWTRIER